MATPEPQYRFDQFDGRRLSRLEKIVTVVFLGAAVAISAAFEVYDTRSPTIRVALTAAGAITSFMLLWFSLTLLRVPRELRSPSALLALLPWNGPLLSQMAYVGYMFIPLEVVASALLLRSKARLRFPVALLVSAVARFAALFAVDTLGTALRAWL